ncbi:hypothetical protein ACFW04_000090 [Cataglyphis niger]
MFCQKEKKLPHTSLPPPCYHCRPIPFRCPSYGCLPPEPRLSRCSFPPSCPPVTCKPRPERSPSPLPTICIAGPCPQSSNHSKSCPPPSAPKILPPSSSVRFCICYTNEGLSYYPCYYSDLPKCPNNLC